MGVPAQHLAVRMNGQSGRDRLGTVGRTTWPGERDRYAAAEAEDTPEAIIEAVEVRGQLGRDLLLFTGIEPVEDL